MTATLDMSTDYLCWENLEEVRVFPAPRLDDTSFDVLKSKRRAITQRELIQGNGAYTGTDMVWLVPQLELGQGNLGYRFQPGDIVRDHAEDPDPETEWTVLTPSWNKLKQTWRLIVRSLALNANLRDTLSILRPLIQYGAATEPVYRWDQAQAIVTGLPCRVQPQTTGVEVHNEVEGAATRYEVILGQQVTLQAFDRFSATITKTGETILLQWTEHRNADRLDELPVVSCVRVG